MEKGYGYFDSAKHLVGAEKNNDALIFVVFDVEELGRAVILNEQSEKASAEGNASFEFPRSRLENHIVKQKAVMSILPDNLVNLAMRTFNT